MKIEELSEIVGLADWRAIEKRLKEAGFRDCKKDKVLRKASLYTIAIAPYEATPYFADAKGREYVGNLCHDAEGYEKYEFALVQLLAPFKRGCEDLSTQKALIYAKEIVKD